MLPFLLLWPDRHFKHCILYCSDWREPLDQNVMNQNLTPETSHRIITIILLLDFTAWPRVSLSIPLEHVYPSWLHEKIVITYLYSTL